MTEQERRIHAIKERARERLRAPSKDLPAEDAESSSLKEAGQFSRSEFRSETSSSRASRRTDDDADDVGEGRYRSSRRFRSPSVEPPMDDGEEQGESSDARQKEGNGKDVSATPLYYYHIYFANINVI